MKPEVRTLSVGALTRVEGEGALHVALRDGAVESVELNIYEPPRFFEAFLRGRAYTEPPDLTARVCGICPVAYQVSACNAIEDACGVVIDPELVSAATPALLRRVDTQPRPAHLPVAPAGFPGLSGRHQPCQGPTRADRTRLGPEKGQ